MRTRHHANTELLRARVEDSIGLVTALNPYIGYTASTRIAQEALISGRRVADLVIEAGLLDREELDRLLSPNISPISAFRARSLMPPLLRRRFDDRRTGRDRPRRSCD